MKNAHGRTCKGTKVYIYLYISLYENLFENGCIYIYTYIYIYIYMYFFLGGGRGPKGVGKGWVVVVENNDNRLVSKGY